MAKAKRLKLTSEQLQFAIEGLALGDHTILFLEECFIGLQSPTEVAKKFGVSKQLVHRAVLVTEDNLERRLKEKNLILRCDLLFSETCWYWSGQFVEA